MDVPLANLRQRGAVRLFATVLRGEFGDTVDVEISAVTMVNGGQPCFGFAIRNVGRRPAASSPSALPKELPRSVEQLTELVGRIALKDLIREATDVIEKLCIEAALQLTGDNHGQVFWVLGVMQYFWYSSDKRRERFVKICMDKDVQRLTWEAYMHKKLVKADHAAHIKIFFKDMAHLLGFARA